MTIYFYDGTQIKNAKGIVFGNDIVQINFKNKPMKTCKIKNIEKIIY